MNLLLALVPSIVLAAAPAWARLDELTSNGGFEDRTETNLANAWSKHGKGYSLDSHEAHTGRGSACVALDDQKEQAGLRQVVVINQNRPQPLLLSGWSKAEDVSGASDQHYALWCDVVYTDSNAPGPADLPGIAAPFPTGTHGWIRSKAGIYPEKPIKEVRLYALLRKHRGKVWFDDISLTPMDLPAVEQRVVGPGHRLATADGLKLRLTADGWLADEQPATGEQAMPVGGLWVTDFEQPEVRVGGKVGSVRDVLHQRAVLAREGLAVDATWRCLADRIEVAGTLRDARGCPRAIDLILRVPLSGEGWQWWSDMSTVGPLTGYVGSDVYPLATVTSASRQGRSIAIPADRPCTFCFAAYPGILEARAKLGISPQSRPAGEAKFSFCLFNTDATWGFRDALRRYYAAYPEAFRKIAPKEGGWLFAYPAEKLPNLEDYAYHEADARNWETDQRLGLALCPYRIPTQRQLVFETLPPDDQAAVREIAALAVASNDARKRLYAELMERCGAWDPSGRPYLVRRDNVGADVRPVRPVYNVVYSVNPSPHLYADRDVPTVGRYELEQIEAMFRQTPALGGVYLDSAFGWVSRYHNYRGEHFAYMRHPLSYDEASGQVCAAGWIHTYEFMAELQRRLTPQGKIVFPNLGGRRTMPFLYFVSDVIGLEQGLRAGEPESLMNYYRAMAYQKPVLVLDYIELLGKPTVKGTPQGFEDYWKWCALYGAHPSIGRRCDVTWERFAPIYRRYREPLKLISAAGWEPVTYAWADAKEAHVERFGDVKRGLFFTAMNTGRETREVELQLNSASLGLPPQLIAHDLLGGFTCSTPLKLPLAAGQLRILQVEAHASKGTSND